MDEDRYVGLTALADQSGLSVRTLQRYLTDKSRPLPHRRVGRRVLVSLRDFNVWVRSFPGTEAPAATSDPKVAAIVRSIRGE